MKQYFTIAVYRCLVAGEPTETLDVQVRFYLAESEKEVRQLLTEKECHTYENSDGEPVEWELRDIMDVEEVPELESGEEEIIGFIAEVGDFSNLA